MKLPSLETNVPALFRLYYNNVNIGTREIKETFKVSSSTAQKVIKRGQEYMREKELPSYTYKAEIPVTVLFEMYGWDIKYITRCARVLQSLK